MSTFRLSAPQRPFYESRPYRPSPARRRFIYGEILPMGDAVPARAFALTCRAVLRRLARCRGFNRLSRGGR
jgi:hypothetical protein